MSKIDLVQSNSIKNYQEEPVRTPEPSIGQQTPQSSFQSEMIEQNSNQDEEIHSNAIQIIEDSQQEEVDDSQDMEIQMNLQNNDLEKSENNNSYESENPELAQQQTQNEENQNRNLQIKGFLQRQTLITGQERQKKKPQKSLIAEQQIQQQNKIYSKQQKSYDTWSAVLSLIDLIMVIITSILAVDAYSKYRHTHCFRQPNDIKAAIVEEELDKNPLYTTDFLYDVEPALVIALILVIFLKGISLISRWLGKRQNRINNFKLQLKRCIISLFFCTHLLPVIFYDYDNCVYINKLIRNGDFVSA